MVNSPGSRCLSSNQHPSTISSANTSLCFFKRPKTVCYYLLRETIQRTSLLLPFPLAHTHTLKTQAAEVTEIDEHRCWAALTGQVKGGLERSDRLRAVDWEEEWASLKTEDVRPLGLTLDVAPLKTRAETLEVYSLQMVAAASHLNFT